MAGVARAMGAAAVRFAAAILVRFAAVAVGAAAIVADVAHAAGFVAAPAADAAHPVVDVVAAFVVFAVRVTDLAVGEPDRPAVAAVPVAAGAVASSVHAAA